jgi:hypothetical protein
MSATEREVGAGHAELFRVLETCDLLGCQLVGEVSPAGQLSSSVFMGCL